MQLKKTSRKFDKGLKKNAAAVMMAVCGLTGGFVTYKLQQNLQQASMKQPRTYSSVEIDGGDDQSKRITIDGEIMTPEEAIAKFPEITSMVNHYIIGTNGRNYLLSNQKGTMIHWADASHLAVNGDEIVRPETVYKLFPEYEKGLLQWVEASDPFTHQKIEFNNDEVETDKGEKEDTLERDVFNPNSVYAPYFYISDSGNVSASEGYYGNLKSQEARAWVTKQNNGLFSFIVAETLNYNKTVENQTQRKPDFHERIGYVCR